MVSIITKFSQSLLFWILKRHAATHKFEATLQFKNELLKKIEQLFGIRPRCVNIRHASKDLHFIAETLHDNERLKIRP